MMKEEKNGAAKDAGSRRSLQIVVFKLGQEEYGLSIDQIKEVVITPGITRMPQSPDYVKGVANIRGNVIAIFDLEQRFGLATDLPKDLKKKYTLVVESEEIKMGLLVNEVPNTISVNADDLDESVSIINESGLEQNYIRGIIKSGARLIILIDIFKVIDKELNNALRKVAAA